MRTEIQIAKENWEASRRAITAARLTFDAKKVKAAIVESNRLYEQLNKAKINNL